MTEDKGNICRYVLLVFCANLLEHHLFYKKMQTMLGIRA